MIQKAFAAQTESIGPRTVRVVCSTGDVDRAGEQIVQSGIDLTAYKTNPVVLFGHDPMMPIGLASAVGMAAGNLVATIEFAPEGVSQKADEICGLVKNGIVNTVSIGFDPIETEPMIVGKPKGPERYLRIELMEISFVSIPCNKNALVVQRAMHTRAVTSEWKVCGADDLEITDDQDWNGRSAARRIFDDAGFDSDEPDYQAAMRGFLVYDSANPTLRGSYKLPFADIIDGKLKAVTDGIRAAASRISQTDIPDDVAKGAQALLDGYEQKIKDREKNATAARRKVNAVRTQKGFSAMKIKSLDDIGTLAWLLQWIGFEQTNARIEMALEGDSSKLPDMLAGVMQDLGTALIAMTVEEVGEAIAEAKGSLGQEDQMDETDGLSDDEIALVQTAKTPALRKFRFGFYRMKAHAGRVKEGKKLSASTMQTLSDAVDMHKDAMKLHAKAIKAVEGCMEDDGSSTETDSTGTIGEGGETTAAGKSHAWRIKRAKELSAKSGA